MALVEIVPLVVFAAVALCHVDINWPLTQFDGTEEQQETGALCGGAQRGTSYAWGIGGSNPFVSLSGDPGQNITVRLSTRENITSINDFNITLIENAVFPESGNYCQNVRIPGANSIAPGTFGTLIAQASGDGESVSACSAVVLINDLKDRDLPAMLGEEPVTLNGRNITMYEFYCSNSTIPAREETACDCHCHGVEEHCSASCSKERVEEARKECAVGESEEEQECDCHCHGNKPHCSSNCSSEAEQSATAQCAASGTVSSLPSGTGTAQSSQPSNSAMWGSEVAVGVHIGFLALTLSLII